MKHLIKYVLGGAILVLVMALVFAPVAAQDNRPLAGEGGTIIQASLGSDPVPLNPLVCAETQCQEAAGFLFPGLLSVDPNTGNFTPTGAGPGALTTSYDVSADGLTYTFHLRDDYKWNDGTPVTSADFLTPGTRSRAVCFRIPFIPVSWIPSPMCRLPTPRPW